MRKLLLLFVLFVVALLINPGVASAQLVPGINWGGHNRTFDGMFDKLKVKGIIHQITVTHTIAVVVKIGDEGEWLDYWFAEYPPPTGTYPLWFPHEWTNDIPPEPIYQPGGPPIYLGDGSPNPWLVNLLGNTGEDWHVKLVLEEHGGQYRVFETLVKVIAPPPNKARPGETRALQSKGRAKLLRVDLK